MSFEAQLSSVTSKLEIPAEFKDYETVSDTQTIVKLETWKHDVLKNLLQLRDLIRTAAHEHSDAEQAIILYHTAAFSGDGDWILDEAKVIAQEVMNLLDLPKELIIAQILNDHVKPIFKTNPHPGLNPSTGRKLSRPLGGNSSHTDSFLGQTWKNHPGLVNVILWCLRYIQGPAYERLWHLLIPPIMTMLDDYEIKHKINGVVIATTLLQEVPPELLRRTGIDVLLFTSFKSCLHFHDNPRSPTLMRAVISATVQLTEKTTRRNSAERFSQLCELLGEGIIGSVWVYASRHPHVIDATLECLPTIINALGIGSARYLKALIPQLTHPLALTGNNVSIQLQISSLRALNVVMEACAVRMDHWRIVVLDRVSQRWVVLVDSKADDQETNLLKEALQDTIRRLVSICPSITKEFALLLETDEVMFRLLLQSH